LPGGGEGEGVGIGAVDCGAVDCVDPGEPTSAPPPQPMSKRTQNARPTVRSILAAVCDSISFQSIDQSIEVESLKHPDAAERKCNPKKDKKMAKIDERVCYTDKRPRTR
jgi:hypothetical protein